MKSKTKLFSILLVALLALPFFMYNSENGEVLGISETDPNSTSIGSGVRSENEDVNEQSNKKSIKGRVVLDPQQRIPVSSNKFNLGSDILVKYGDLEINLVVNQINPALEDDVILSLNSETYNRFNSPNANFFEAEVVKQ